MCAVCRRYATVERRAQLTGSKNYCSIPSDGELAEAITSLTVPTAHDQVGQFLLCFSFMCHGLFHDLIIS